MEGYHGTVFAYGMTGTGKTFSMNGTTASPGIIPQSITDIFSYIRETPRREFLLRVSYLEIYNEKIHDLLSVDPNEGVANQQTEEIKLREDSKRGVYATPLKEEIVQSPTQLLRVISRGDQARKTGRTQWNAHSSRSHAVVQIVVESRERALADKRAPMTPGGVRVSTLSLIDLAGSERAAEDKTRRTEGAHINKSLLTLGTIIAKLSGGKDKNGNPIDKEGAHLPYRDSKLTRLLQPALSGNSLISILCTIQIGSSGSSAAANSHTGETLNTLKFASRAKNNIVSHAKRAEEAKGSSTDAASGALLEQYRMEIQGLRSQLDKQMKQQAEKDEKLMEKEEKQRHGETLLDMQLARTALKERIEHLNRIIITSQSTGVNSGKFSSLSMHPKLAAYSNSEAGARSSLRSSTSYTTIQRTTSGASSGTQHTTTPLETVHSPNGKSRFEEDDDDVGDGEASLQAQIRSLRHDITNKNRYITTLERRVDQARRSSHNRFSNGYGPFAAQVAAHEQAIEEKDAALKAKDAELKALRTRLDEQEKTISALRATTLKNGTESVASPAATPTEVAGPFSASTHKPQDSTASGASSNSASLSPVELLSSPSIPPIAKFNSSVSFSPDLTSRDRKRESVDEMSRMLDQMIQSRVEQGALVRSQTGSVRVGRGMERRKESLGGIPSVGALARVLRPESQWLDGEDGNNGASTTIQEGKVF
jgi:centromeric protein E